MIRWPVATDSDATNKGLVACRPGFWAERRPALQRVNTCQQSERYNKVCDPRSSWFVTLSYRRRAVERSGSTGPTILSHLVMRAGSSTTMMAGDEPARVNNFGISRHFKIIELILIGSVGHQQHIFRLFSHCQRFFCGMKNFKKKII